MRYRFLFIMLFGLFAIACASASTAEKKPEESTVNTTTNPKTDAAVPTATVVNTNANVTVIRPYPTNANRSMGNVGMMANAKPLTYAAPDDSDYGTTMNSKGLPVETRTFHTDKYIAKVVRTWLDMNKKSVAIYLRSGKVIEVPGDKWSEIRTIPISELYEAARIKPSPAAEMKRKSEQPQ